MHPEGYRYWEQLVAHIGDEPGSERAQDAAPRQLELHLPADHVRPCPLACAHCAGRFLSKHLAPWEPQGLALIEALQGWIPHHIYSGAFTEPTANPYLLQFIETTKQTGSSFGVHTAGVLLSELEQQQGFLSRLHALSTGPSDYLSISLDAGTRATWAKLKRADPSNFDAILTALRQIRELRRERGKTHAVRLCYLLSAKTASAVELQAAVELAREFEVDSLRFSVAAPAYGQPFSKLERAARKHRDGADWPEHLAPLLSLSTEARPYVFFTRADFADVASYDFQQCIAPAYEVTIGADGYFYRCAATASPTMSVCRLGRVSGLREEFVSMLRATRAAGWRAQRCFQAGARCNRVELEINRTYAARQTQASAERTPKRVTLPLWPNG